MSIEIGIKGRAEDVVREENTAQAVYHYFREN